jgi:hypothetical protein
MIYYKAFTPIMWGGYIEGETFQDVIDKAKSAAPSVTFSRYGDVTVGGWPVYNIMFDEADKEAMVEMFDLHLVTPYKKN